MREAEAADREAAEARFGRAVGRFEEQQREAFEEGLGYARKERDLKHGAAPLQPWLVTDFVTLGSPLAYGDFLRAERPADFEESIALLETPTCPPEPHWDWDPATGEYRESKPRAGAQRRQWGSYGFRKSPGDGRYYWHQAAPFGLTRWTNLYYPGDVVAGRIADVFGPGVRDVRLEPEAADRGGFRLPLWPHWSRRPGAHVRYWRSRQGPPLEAAVRWLRELIFLRAGAAPPTIDEQPARSVNRGTARYDEVPAHLERGSGAGRFGPRA